MTVTASDFLPALRELDFVRSVDRRLLHRRALSEVFLTDTAAVDRRRFLAGAQLPSSHAYFTDHVGHSVIDPMLLLECARQAETCGAHRHLGVDDDTKFVLQSWSMRLPGLFHAHSGDPAELTMRVSTDRAAGASAPARSAAYDMRFLVSGQEVGEVRMAVGYVSSAAYSVIRSKRRGRPPVSSDDVAPLPATVQPAEVGRANAETNANRVARGTVLLELAPLHLSLGDRNAPRSAPERRSPSPSPPRSASTPPGPSTSSAPSPRSAATTRGPTST
ncbi:hypothetical protein C6N75_27640 [Streptomyces solincola]|uniref:A-factor biosynthesis hotdog domain-containing protein n=1 Tax=Streptomyces solincola TaxID=2100817 RepID=A0A2S9PNS3_9ACTN|nr:AfsA-related hotdog domain-containing protein [Streptomyces solincola]PRH76059.1 hypothetical protein C6N75_27640 [Streptomyces solincola]